MAKLPTSPSYEKEIKQDLKAVLQMTRAPRNLDVFYYFLHCYRNQQSLLNKTNTTSIGGKLRRKRIELVAPSTKIIKEKLNTPITVYEKYFDTFVIWLNKTSNSFSGRARTISGWSEAAVALFKKWSHIEIPSVVERLFYLDTRDLNNKITTSIGGKLARPFYHRTRNSYRWYHPAQGLTTAEKKEIFRGHFNIDIVSCFTSIWWYDLQGYDCELQNAELLNPEHKAELLSIIKRDFNVTDNKRAKQIRTKLTSSKRHWTEKTGVKWYDDLREHIIIKAKKWGEHNLPEGIKLTVHNVFTYLEWQIVERLLEAGEEALLIHDGIIFSELDQKKLHGKAWPHQVKIERW